MPLIGKLGGRGVGVNPEITSTLHRCWLKGDWFDAGSILSWDLLSAINYYYGNGSLSCLQFQAQLRLERLEN
jgi:hypothetical protein